MKKIVYISNVCEDITPGYKEKIRAQASSFAEAGFKTYLYTLQKMRAVLFRIEKGEFVVVSEDKFCKFGVSIFNKIYYRVGKKKNRIFIEGILGVCDKIQPDYIYVRRVLPLTRETVKVLSKISKKGIKIIYEYPTYPWEQEMKQSVGFRLDRLIIEKHLSSKLDTHIFRYAVILGDNIKLGYKYIEISNGYNLDKIKKRTPIQFNDNTIRLLVVAHLMKWHGIDRIILGLADYYAMSTNSHNIIINIVGEGAILEDLKLLVDKLNLNSFVIFHGKKTGLELDTLYDTCDIGVGSLGMYRIGLNRGSTLKLREYCAKGLPFIYAYNDLDFDIVPFAFKFPNDNEKISIDKLIEFYFSLNYDHVADEMREYAEKHLVWSSKMQPVIKSITN